MALQQAKSLRRQADDLILTRKWSEAIQLLSTSITLEPANFLGYLKRSQAYQGVRAPTCVRMQSSSFERSQAGMYASALADVEEVLKRKPDHLKSAGKRIELLLQLGRYSDAQASAQQVLNANPGARFVRLLLL